MNARGRSTNASASQSTSQQTENEEYRRLDKIEEDLSLEIAQIDEEIENLKKRREDRELRRKDYAEARANLATTSVQPSHAVLGAAHNGINYSAQFQWSPKVQVKMRNVFKINKFRLCQEGAINACMDGRDVVCVMPTGGGKSLTYQLPALMLPGCTLVVSPLISLMTDQTLYLQTAGVRCLMLSGAMSEVEYGELLDEGKDIKLCYITPERISMSRSFMTTLQKLYHRNRLSRFVVDEAHCLSQMGHDYRRDYRELSVLRQLFPKVPITAVTATCPPAVLGDLTKVLGLNKVTDGLHANHSGTVYFSSPLYRKNLHYRIIPKPEGYADAVETLSDWIEEHHSGESGIIYCLSKQEAQDVATGLGIASGSRIKTGVYHAGIDGLQRRDLHVRWRTGQINIVCATVAFGLGIDKGDVRFVVHFSMPKSIDGFYQESGRAGRDGLDADCILYYRPQDMTRLSSMVYKTVEGKHKLHDMLSFLQDMYQCRKFAFAKYFSTTSNIEMSSWTTADASALSACGHCDNCRRPPYSFENRDVTLEAWQILKITEEVRNEGERSSLAQLGEIVRGLGSMLLQLGESSWRPRGHRPRVHLDVDELIGGKITLTKENTEYLIIELLLQGFLIEEHEASDHTVNTYLTVSEKATQLTQVSREDLEVLIEEGRPPVSVQCTFPLNESEASAGVANDGARRKPLAPTMSASSSSNRKGKGRVVEPSETDSASESEYHRDRTDGQGARKRARVTM